MNETLDIRAARGREPAAARPPGRGATGGGGGDLWIYLLLGALVWGAWELSALGLWRAGDALGYGLGVAGGVMMLLLFGYPLRKYVRPLHRLGRIKWWFVAHMALGVGGPVAILLHSTFRIGSTNAAVALWSMVIVAGSGVAGRFLYLRIHRGLSGEKAQLQALRERAGHDGEEARSRLRFAPKVDEQLRAFADGVLGARQGAMTSLRHAFWLPLQAARVKRTCARELHVRLKAMARLVDPPAAETARRERLARKLVSRYVDSTVRVAQFSAFERLFALWHVAHVPFVYLMVVSAVVHVIAVHAY